MNSRVCSLCFPEEWAGISRTVSSLWSGPREVDARQQQKSMPGSKEVDARQQQKSMPGSNRSRCPAATEVARDFRPPLRCEWDLRSSATLHRVGCCPQVPRVVMGPGSDFMVYFTTLLVPHLTTTTFSWPHHLGARCRLVVNAMPRTLNPRERDPISTAGLDVWRREIILFLRRSSNPKLSSPKFTRYTGYGSPAPRQ